MREWIAGSRRDRSLGDEAGMSMVEVLIALGVMAGVLISVASLFILGGQRVKGGRDMTQAVAVASDILEELNNIGGNTLPETMPDCCIPNCDTSTGCTVDSRTDGYASVEWQPWIDQELFQGYAEVTLTPVGGATAPPNFTSSEGLRLSVEIFWTEGTSQRSVVSETVEF